MPRLFKYTKNENGGFICPHCDYTNQNQSSMHYHLKTHAKIREHVCEYCKIDFPQKSLLDLHITARHAEKLKPSELKEKTFKCPCKGCDYKDVRKGNRLIHFVRVHLKELVAKLKIDSEASECIAKCTACEKEFKSMTQFYYHAGKCVTVPKSHTLAPEWASVRA
jgi:hypothetical protein